HLSCAVLDHSRDQLGINARGNAKAHRAGRTAGVVTQQPPRFIYVGENSRSSVEQQLPGVGRLDAAAMARDELGMQLVLKISDMHPERRLRDVQRFGGLRDTAQLQNSAEISKLSNVHGYASLTHTFCFVKLRAPREGGEPRRWHLPSPHQNFRQLC